MKNMTKRIVALVLAVAMMITSLPTMANAANSVDVTLYGKDASYTFDRGAGDGTITDLQSSNTSVVSVREGDKDLTHWWADVIVTANSIGTATITWTEEHSWPFKDEYISKTVEVKEAQVDRIEILNPIKDNEIILGKNDKHNFNIKVYAKEGQTFFNNKIEDTAVWATSDAEVITVDQTGKIEALKEGTATISVTVAGVKENVTLKVVTEGVKSVTITNKLETIKNTDKPDFNATVVAKGNLSKEVTWSVSDETVATIDENGVLTPLIGNASVTVTATSVADETKSDSFTLRINWDSNGGSSKYEHINVRVVDDAGNEIEGAKVTMRLGQLIGSDKTFGPLYSEKDGKVTFNFDSYEWIWWIQAEKEGYITQKDVYSEPGLFGYIYYIGFLASSNEYLTIKMHKINTYDVTYKYENTIFESDTLYEGEKVDAAMITSATSKAEQYAEQLTRESNEYTYTFAGFDKDLTDVEIKEDTVVTAVYNTALKGNKVVSFWLAKGDNVEEYDQQSTELPKEELKNKSDDEIKAMLANFIGNKVVNRIEQTADEVKVIYNTNCYKFVYLEKGVDDKSTGDNDKIKDNRTRYYVLDVENNDNYTAEQEYDDNAEELIAKYNLNENVRIANSEESWVYVAKEFVENFANQYTKFALWFTKKIANPIDIEHKIYFNNVAMSDKQGAEVYPTETIIVEEAGKTVEQEKIDHTDNEAVKAAYIKYALPTCHVDENYLGVDSVKYVPTDKGAKIVITYWAKRINVQYEGFDAEGKSVGEIKDEWHKIVNYMDYDHAEMSKYLNVLDENNKPQTISFNGVQYRLNADKSTAEGKHSCTGTTGKKDDFNVVTITLAYDFDVQANCEHELEYVDKGDYHNLECSKCGYVETEKEAHEYVKHFCEKCGHEEAREEITMKMHTIVGLVTPLADGEYLAKSIDKYAWEISEEFNDSDAREEYLEANPDITGLAEEDEEDVAEAIKAALTKDPENLVLEKDSNKWYIQNVRYGTYFDKYYNIKVELLMEGDTYSQIELKNVTKWDEVVKEIKKEIKKQKETDSFKLPELATFNFTLNGEVVDTLAYGNVYECVVTFGSDLQEKMEYTGKVHLFHKSSNKRKPNEIKIDDPLVAQAGELLNDLRTNRPNDLITRAEFVGVLANIFQVPEDRIYDKNWNLEGCDQIDQIKKLATYVIVKGYSDDEFGQNDTITTEQVYTILARALKFQAKVKEMTAEEIKAELAKAQNAEKVSDWAEEGVSIALKMGIAAATETAPTEPQNGVMRMTAADTLQKYIEIVAVPTEQSEVKVEE